MLLTYPRNICPDVTVILRHFCQNFFLFELLVITRLKFNTPTTCGISVVLVTNRSFAVGSRGPLSLKYLTSHKPGGGNTSPPKTTAWEASFLGDSYYLLPVCGEEVIRVPQTGRRYYESPKNEASHAVVFGGLVLPPPGLWKSYYLLPTNREEATRVPQKRLRGRLLILNLMRSSDHVTQNGLTEGDDI